MGCDQICCFLLGKLLVDSWANTACDDFHDDDDDEEAGITLANQSYIMASRKELVPPVIGVMSHLCLQARGCNKCVHIEIFRRLWQISKLHFGKKTNMGRCSNLCSDSFVLFFYSEPLCSVIMQNMSLSVWHCDLLLSVTPHPPLFFKWNV